MINTIPGTWHLHYSTFPMWQKEGVHAVTFNYTAITLEGKAALLDEVKYLKGDRPRSVVGHDRQDALDRSTFIWRGKGLLWLFQSRWRVEWMSEDHSTMIISFDKTLVTQSGIDILTRADADAAGLVRAQEIIAERSLLADVKEPLLPVMQ